MCNPFVPGTVTFPVTASLIVFDITLEIWDSVNVAQNLEQLHGHPEPSLRCHVAICFVKKVDNILLRVGLTQETAERLVAEMT